MNHSVRARVKKMLKTSSRPRLIVNRSNQFIYAQILDASGQVLAAANSLKSNRPKSEQALTVGQQIAAIAREKNITAVTFDRNGLAYRGAVRILAEAARKEGLVI